MGCLCFAVPSQSKLSKKGLLVLLVVFLLGVAQAVSLGDLPSDETKNMVEMSEDAYEDAYEPDTAAALLEDELLDEEEPALIQELDDVAEDVLILRI